MTGKVVQAEGPFAYPAFRTLWISNLATNIGVLIQSVGASWVMVEAGAKPQLVALVQTAASLPLVLISPMSGAIADSMDRRHVMMAAQILLFACSLTLALLAASGNATPLIVLSCTFLVGSCMAFNGPAWLASVGDILPRPAIPGAVIYNAIGLNLARSAGPAIGGAIVTIAGSTVNFVVNAATSASLFLVLYFWRPEVAKPAPRSDSLAAVIAQGFRYAYETGPVRAALTRAMLFGTVASAVQALLPLIARDVLRGGPAVFGLLFGAFGVGALIGALASTRLRRRFAPEAMVKLCTACSAIGTLGAAWSTVLGMTLCFLLLAGAAWVVAFSTFNVAIQLSSPRWIVARLLSLYQMSVFAGVALGSWVGGGMADHIGTPRSLSAMALAAVASLLAGKAAPLEPEPTVASGADVVAPEG